MSELVDAAPRRPVRQDTFDLREDLVAHEELDDSLMENDYEDVYESDQADHHRSIIEDEDDEDDDSSQLSIPNESIDFDLVYSLRNFVATTEGQANVHKGDTLFLMDDSNSYWWLVRVLKTGDIGYIPAENIETPIERLARLNKHRNVDLASATPAELEDDTVEIIQTRRAGSRAAVSADRRSVIFTGSSVYFYPPFVWGDPGRPLEDPPDDLYEEDDGDYAAYEDSGHYDEEENPVSGMEPDDGMSWEDDIGIRPQPSQVSSGVGRSDQLGTISQNPSELIQPLGQQPTVGLGLPSIIRERPSRENLSSGVSASPTSREYIDPAEASETRKLSVTPSIARDAQPLGQMIEASSHNQRALSISSTGSGASSSESGGNKRLRDDAESDADSRRAKAKGPNSKLRKERSASGESRDSGESSDRQISDGKEKKKVGFLGGLFGRKKEKDKKEIRRVASPSDMESITRSSADSFVTGSADHGPESAIDDPSMRLASHQPRIEGPERVRPPESNRSLQSASNIRVASSGATQPESTQSSVSNPSTNSTLQPPSRGTRPGSLILSSSTADGLGAIVPELSVLRVFAGDHLQSEATFKTVLINATTTTAGLVRQAMQRFRLPEGEDPNDYYLTIKQVDGDEAVLRPDEHPLQAFEQLAEQSAQLPSIKRTSMASINSLASNLSMSIAKLGMNDFTDDSTVKLYIHRSVKGSDGDLTPRESMDAAYDAATVLSEKQNLLTVSTAGANLASVSPERFSSPSTRFALQVFIYPDDLPDGMVFDPHTEAIVPRSTLQHRSSSSATVSPGVSQTQRRKVFVFPKNTTVAEVIEASLERFGILEGVVEGGDEVEDKPAKRRSSSRVRYGLNVLFADGQQRELQPSSKVLEAFARPPLFKTVDRRSSEWRRRSVESTHLMGNSDDIQDDDPSFVLRRVVGARNAKGKNAGPLDELALRQLHRESASSDASGLSSSASSQKTQKGPLTPAVNFTVRPNRDNGIDITTEGGLYRSQRKGASAPTYVFVRRNGATIDVTTLLVDELGSAASRDSTVDLLDQASMASTTVLSASLSRLQDKIMSMDQTSNGEASMRASVVSPSVYSQSSRNGSGSGTPVPREGQQSLIQDTPRSRSATPTATSKSAAPGPQGPIASRATASLGPRTASPTPSQRAGAGHHSQPSIASIMSDFSAYTSGSESVVHDGPVLRSAEGGLRSASALAGKAPPTSNLPLSGESGISRMLAIVELSASLAQPPQRPEPSILDQTFLGTPINLDELHPRVREFFEPAVHNLEDMGKNLDRLLLLSQSVGRS